MKHTFWNFTAAIKNGLTAKKQKIIHSNTKLNRNVAEVLWNEGYILGFRTLKNGKLEIFLKYNKNCVPTITNIKSLSKPGKRIYFSHKNICKISNESCIIILSTTRGIRTSVECKKFRLGGEPLLVIS